MDMKKRVVVFLMVLAVLAPMLLVALPQKAEAAGDVTYKIITKTCSGWLDGTNSANVVFTIYGLNGSITLDKMGQRIAGNAFRVGETDTYTFTTSDLGEIYGMSIGCGSDALKLKYVEIEKLVNGSYKTAAYFNVDVSIKSTTKNFFDSTGQIYKVKFVTADNVYDGTKGKIQLRIMDTMGQSVTISDIAAKAGLTELLSGTEGTFCYKEGIRLQDLRYVALKNSGSDYWRPAYIQVCQLSSWTTTMGNPQWTEEVLFIGDQEIGTTEKKLERSYGSVKTDSASGLASIFFDPNFYVILTIVVLLTAAGVIVYYKKKNTGKEKVK